MTWVQGGALGFVTGFSVGWLIRHYLEKWTVMHNIRNWFTARWATVRAHLPQDIPRYSWGTVLLAIAVGIMGITYWLDHQRWDEYLDCQQDSGIAQKARAGPTAERDAWQSVANHRQGSLNDALYDISLVLPLDGVPPTPEEQVSAIAAQDRLEVVSARAAAAYDVLDVKQRELDEVRAEYPLPDCGEAPG